MHMLRNYLVMAVVATCLFGWVNAAGALPADPKVPQLFQYQARLMDASGAPINESVAVKVYLYDSATAGFSGDLSDEHLLYAENHEQINVSRGTLRVTVGNGEPLGPFANGTLPLKSIAETSELYLEIEIDGETVSPRQRIAFSSRSFAAAYAKSARDLAGDLKITTGSFPGNFAAEKITTGEMDPLRFPVISDSKLSDTGTGVYLGAIPYDIPLSKLGSTSGQTIATDLLPNIPAPKVQAGTFDPARLPTSVLAPTAITVEAGHVLSGGSVGQGPGDCQCMAALHSTDGGGAEGMNTAQISLDSSGGAVGCTMSFEENGMVKNNTPECAPFPNEQSGCASYCTSSCSGSQVPNCNIICLGECIQCFTSTSVTLPCNASYMCVCVD